MRVLGDGGCGGVEKRLLVDSAPALSSGVHKQTLINRRRRSPPPPKLFFSLSHLQGNNLELGAPKRDCSENDRGRTHGGREGENKGELKAQCENSLFFFFLASVKAALWAVINLNT